MAGGVSLRYVTAAVSLKKTDPILFAKVKDGKIPLLNALRQVHPRRYPRYAEHRNGAAQDESDNVPQADIEDTIREAQARYRAENGIDITKITGLLGGIKIVLDLTPQEFKILNQAVNPECRDNEELVFATKFVQSLKTRYPVIRQHS